MERQFPRLLGMNIGDKNYQKESYQSDLAKMDIVVLGFYKGWNREGKRIRDIVKVLKHKNPHLLVGQYTVLNEASVDPQNLAQRDVQEKVTENNWWLKDASGNQTHWTSEFNTWDINFTLWAKPDAKDLRYPQWRAERDYGIFFKEIPEFDIWYLDNVFIKPRVKKADWDMDGKNDSAEELRVVEAHRAGHNAEWQHIRKIHPKIMLMGNADNDLSQPEFSNKLEAAFLEGLMGYRWSIESKYGWEKMMERYNGTIKNTREPHLVGFNVGGNPQDYRFFRYAFTSCLMNNGFFSFTDINKGYSSVPWFDEYDIKLGRAIDPPQNTAWRNGVFRRLFENGMALVNPTGEAKRIKIDAGYKKFIGKQAPQINDGNTADTLVLPPKDGIVLIK